MTDAPILSELLSNLFPKNSGIVAVFKCCDISLVLLPRITHANSEPISALPIPIQVEAMPNFHPNCPA